jgi:hypothetical protein
MNYCSLEDAWGSSNRMCSQYKNYMDDKNNTQPGSYQTKFDNALGGTPFDNALGSSQGSNQTLGGFTPQGPYQSNFDNALGSFTPQGPLLKQNTEHFSDVSYQSSHLLDKQNNSNHYNNNFHELVDCDNFLNHIHTCKKCHNKVKNYFKPKIVENIQDIVEDNKDTIVLILIGISILLFLI